MVVLHVLEGMVVPPSRYPDIFPALFAIYGAMNFSAAYVYGVAWLWNSSSSSAEESSSSSSTSSIDNKKNK
jgi:hypothetical protein